MCIELSSDRALFYEFIGPFRLECRETFALIPCCHIPDRLTDLRATGNTCFFLMTPTIPSSIWYHSISNRDHNQNEVQLQYHSEMFKTIIKISSQPIPSFLHFLFGFLTDRKHEWFISMEIWLAHPPYVVSFRIVDREVIPLVHHWILGKPRGVTYDNPDSKEKPKLEFIIDISPTMSKPFPTCIFFNSSIS